MGRPTKDWVKITLCLDRKFDSLLRQYCKDTGLTLTAAVERFIKSCTNTKNI